MWGTGVALTGARREWGEPSGKKKGRKSKKQKGDRAGTKNTRKGMFRRPWRRQLGPLEGKTLCPGMGERKPKGERRKKDRKKGRKRGREMRSRAFRTRQEALSSAPALI